MTDLEITRLCAEAMGITVRQSAVRGTIMRWCYTDGNVEKWYQPLYDDAQAMALVKKFRLIVEPKLGFGLLSIHPAGSGPEISIGVGKYAANLNRAICECVAKMEQAKK